MRFGLDVSQHQLTWDEILRRTRLAEELGFDGAWVFDHFKALYGDPSGPCMEAYTLLAALGASTTRIRLGALVTGITYRHPSILATEAVTVDHISNGRLELGVGAAWFQGEHDELGIDFAPTAERIRRLDEGIDVMRLLMTSDGVSYDGRYYRLENATYRPRPVQQPHPPIWVGGRGEKLMLPLIARQADAWHGFGSPEDMKRRSEIIDRHAEKAGRDPSSILRSGQLSLSQSMDDVKRSIDAMAEAGVGYLTVGWPSEGQQRVEELARLLPEYAGTGR